MKKKVLLVYAQPEPTSLTRQLVDVSVQTKASWRLRLQRLFDEAPIPFRPQNGGDYPDGHVLTHDVAVGRTAGSHCRRGIG
jgi:hypothetical protein